MSKSFEETGTGAPAFGERLRREREMRGISLDEISAVTKIGKRLLRALEDEQFDLLPGGIFNKGYVRAYARHLGIDEEQAVADYLKAANEAPPDVKLIAHQSSVAHGDGGERGASSFHRRGFPVLPVLILLLLVVGAAAGWRLYRQHRKEHPSSGKLNSEITGQLSSSGQTTVSNGGNSSLPQTASVPPASVSEVPPNAGVHTVEAAENPSRLGDAASPATSGTPGSEAGTPFEITVRAKDRARVEIKSDGKVVLRGVMNPADLKTIHATNKIVFWTANAGELELSFNGKSVALSGGENDEQVLVFDSRGLLPRPAAQ